MNYSLYQNLLYHRLVSNLYLKKSYHINPIEFLNLLKNRLIINDEKKICYIESTSSFNYGLKAGKYYKFEYHLIDKLSRIFNTINIDKAVIKNYINYIRNFHHSTYEEFEGLSSSTNINVERLVYLHILLYSLFSGKCTNMLATGKATKNNETFLIQNLDGEIHLTIFVRLLTFKIWINTNTNSNEYKYAYIGIPVIFEKPLINEAGLGLGQTATLCNKKRYGKTMDREGVDINFLIKTTMKTCKNVTEVAELWKNTKIAHQKRSNEINQTTAWCDKEDGILLIESGPDIIKTVFGYSTDITKTKEGILWHARHHQWLDGRKTGSYLPSECYYSILNAEKSKELLEKNYGNITLETCKEMASYHGKNKEEALCKHPDRKRLVFTCCSYIVQPKELMVYLTHGSPCKSKFCKYDFTKKFKK